MGSCDFIDDGFQDGINLRGKINIGYSDLGINYFGSSILGTLRAFVVAEYDSSAKDHAE